MDEKFWLTQYYNAELENAETVHDASSDEILCQFGYSETIDNREVTYSLISTKTGRLALCEGLYFMPSKKKTLELIENYSQNVSCVSEDIENNPVEAITIYNVSTNTKVPLSILKWL